MEGSGSRRDLTCRVKADTNAPPEHLVVALGDRHGNNISYIVFQSRDPESPVGRAGYILEATFSENGIFTDGNLLVYSKAGLLADKAAPKLKELVLQAHGMNFPSEVLQNRTPLLPVLSDQLAETMSCGLSNHKARIIASAAISFLLPCGGMEDNLLHLNDPFDLVANMTQVPFEALLEQEGVKQKNWAPDVRDGDLCGVIWVMAMANDHTLCEAQSSPYRHSCYKAQETIQRRLDYHGIPGNAYMTYNLARSLQDVFASWYDNNPSAGTLLSIRAVDGHMVMIDRYKFLNAFVCGSFLEALWRQKKPNPTSRSDTDLLHELGLVQRKNRSRGTHTPTD